MSLTCQSLTYFQNPVYLYRFCVFEIFVRLANTDENGVCSTSYMAAHIYVRPQGRVMDRGTIELYFASQSSTRRLAIDFLMLLQAFAGLPKICMPTFGNGRNNSKTAFCLYRVRYPKLGYPALFTLVLFLAQ